MTDQNTNPEAMAAMPAVTSNPFDVAVKPKVLDNAKELFLFRCGCGNIHLRHAGYVELMLPLVLPDRTARVESESHQVKVCTSCKKCFIWHHSQMYDVTKLIDLAAWDKTEREMQAATGPGGDC